jgi:hypothetical protein
MRSIAEIKSSLDALHPGANPVAAGDAIALGIICVGEGVLHIAQTLLELKAIAEQRELREAAASQAYTPAPPPGVSG